MTNTTYTVPTTYTVTFIHRGVTYKQDILVSRSYGTPGAIYLKADGVAVGGYCVFAGCSKDIFAEPAEAIRYWAPDHACEVISVVKAGEPAPAAAPEKAWVKVESKRVEPAAKKAPAHSTPRYVAARIKSILKKHGFLLAKRTGRYSPYGSTQEVTEGFTVRRVGVGKTVSIYYDSPFSGRLQRTTELPSAYRAAKVSAGLELLRAHGYRVDHRGWVECDHYDF